MATASAEAVSLWTLQVVAGICNWALAGRSVCLLCGEGNCIYWHSAAMAGTLVLASQCVLYCEEQICHGVEGSQAAFCGSVCLEGCEQLRRQSGPAVSVRFVCL